MKSETFTVDAALLEELGERLIGRAHIAMAELVKNAYDADAVICRIEFGDDQITISDDGHGMSESDFLDHWMRIGTTHKIDQKLSRELGRPLTGSKGVGRLSVQFLAEEMTLYSTSKEGSDQTLMAMVDWRGVVRGKDLSTVSVEWDTQKEAPVYPGGHDTGTLITLKGLKEHWDTEAIRDLGEEVWVLRSPFKRPGRRPARRGPEDFYIDIEAPHIADAESVFNEVLDALFSNWKARITGSITGGRTGESATISVEFKLGYPEGSLEGTSFREAVMLPVRSRDDGRSVLIDRARFEILVFKPEGRQPGGFSVADLRAYLADFGNVSVYDAGFRLPYYGSGRDPTGQDWLSIAVDQGRRLNTSELLPEHLRTQNRYMQDLPAPGRIFGAVEIDTNHERAAARKSPSPSEKWLQLQPGRDRLHSNPAFDQLRDLVRFSLDFYANRYRLLAVQAVEKKRAKEPPSRKFQRAVEVLDRSKPEIPATVFREVRREIVDARKALVSEEEALDQRAVLLAPLATAGMTALALNHELAREASFLARAAERLQAIAQSQSIPELESIAVEFDEARQRLDALQELFAPLLSDTDTKATTRLRVRPLIEHVVRSMRPLLPGVTFDWAGVPSDLWFPLGSFAEWNALLQNLLSNAWNAMLATKKAAMSFDGGRDRRGREWLRISDTGEGIGVPLAEAEILFEPFERRLTINEDQRSIAIGGQGLGLAIVRMIARRRSTRVAFIEPGEGFSTTLEISWRGAKK